MASISIHDHTTDTNRLISTDQRKKLKNQAQCVEANDNIQIFAGNPSGKINPRVIFVYIVSSS